jgi:hypothetical protein
MRLLFERPSALDRVVSTWKGGSKMLDPRHKALLDEVWHRIELASDDPKVLNRDGRTSWRGPRVRGAVERRADDGPALVAYIRGVLRKRESEGWNALREADRLQYSFEDMVANPPDPRIAELFSDEDRELATRLLSRKPSASAGGGWRARLAGARRRLRRGFRPGRSEGR